jgi:hypothetical protein
VLAALVLAGCGGAPEASGPVPSTGIATPGGSTTPTTRPDESAEPLDPGPTELPPSESPSGEATDAPETDEPSSTAGSGPAAACAGNDDNRDFFSAVAAAVSWQVYCPILPDGWFVAAGQYRLAGGGWMEISYRGPADATIELRQGVVCGDGTCSPSGDDLGEAAYGDRSGTLWNVGNGGYEVLVDPAADLSWVLIASGLSEAEVRSIAGDLLPVGD